MNRTMWARNLLALVWLTGGMTLASSNIVFGDDIAAAKLPADWQSIPDDGIINKPGRYCLQQDLRTDRSTGIKIMANDVTIDLGGHAVRYTGIPKEGTFGIASPDRTNVTIVNGAIGGFWFNMHCTQNKRLRISDIRFDDIPYIGINVADSKDIVISDNTFENFRYDLPKDDKSHYVVAINIGAQDAVIANNHFNAAVKPGTGKDVNIETVFVLFSAQVSKDCVVTKNEMVASETLPRSYGIWIANNAQATIVDNDIQNMLYGVCLAGEASAMVCYNRIAVEKVGDAVMETRGISASGAKEIFDIKNTFEGVSIPVSTPQVTAGAKAGSG